VGPEGGRVFRLIAIDGYGTEGWRLVQTSVLISNLLAMTRRQLPERWA
jgi:hypothetical protein